MPGKSRAGVTPSDERAGRLVHRSLAQARHKSSSIAVIGRPTRSSRTARRPRLRGRGESVHPTTGALPNTSRHSLRNPANRRRAAFAMAARRSHGASQSRRHGFAATLPGARAPNRRRRRGWNHRRRRSCRPGRSRSCSRMWSWRSHGPRPVLPHCPAPVGGIARHLRERPAFLLGEHADHAATTRPDPLGAEVHGAVLRLLLARLVDARKDAAVLLHHHAPACGAGAAQGGRTAAGDRVPDQGHRVGPQARRQQIDARRRRGAARPAPRAAAILVDRRSRGSCRLGLALGRWLGSGAAAPSTILVRPVSTRVLAIGTGAPPPSNSCSRHSGMDWGRSCGGSFSAQSMALRNLSR